MLEVRDPADVRSVVAEVPAMSASEVAAAYTRARAGFDAWRHANPLDRATVMARCADLIRARKLGPALIAGNAVVLKPASQTPQIALWLADLLMAAGLPGNVVTVVTGGDRPAAASLEYGCYVSPTIISVNTKHSLWREEVFGPVVAVCEANAFDEAGQVSVNLPTSGWDVHHPFGGFRESGSAFKEQGGPGLRFYTRIKTSAVRFAW
jgi:alpha-ketoglutaric semialdehyde dehydrogenase